MKTFTTICRALIIIFCVISCGPSKEELEKRAKELKEKQEATMAVYKKHRPAADAYMQKLKDLIPKLEIGKDSSVVFTGTMSPLLSEAQGDKEGNILLLSYGALFDTSGYAAAHDDFGMYMRSKANQALSSYKSLKKNGELYTSAYASKEQIEKIVSSLSSEVTPYALIVRRVFTTPVKVVDKYSYSGGVTLGVAWLADLRSMEILGSTFFTALPGDLMIKERESNIMLQMKAKESSNKEANKIIRAWLKKFKDASIS